MIIYSFIYSESQATFSYKGYERGHLMVLWYVCMHVCTMHVQCIYVLCAVIRPYFVQVSDAFKAQRHSPLGPSIKYVTLEGVREGVTVCDRREGVQEHVMSHFSNFFRTYET